jgi:hypothetical protein
MSHVFIHDRNLGSTVAQFETMEHIPRVGECIAVSDAGELRVDKIVHRLPGLVDAGVHIFGSPYP